MVVRLGSSSARCDGGDRVLRPLPPARRGPLRLRHRPTLSGFDGLVTSEGTIYPLLARLRQEGYVETTWHESSQGPPRRYYRITDSGRGALHAFVTQWERFRDSVDKLLEGEGWS